MQKLERLLLERAATAVPMRIGPRIEVLLEGHEVADGLLDDVAHVDGGGYVFGVHDLPHKEDPQFLGGVRVLIPAELPQGILVVADQSPDGDGVSYSVSYHLIQ